MEEMTNQQEHDAPVQAAELARKARGGLSRYTKTPDTLTEIAGTLEDVQTMPEGGAWIVVRPVDGVKTSEFASATVRKPTPEVDRMLESIGKDGRITLLGMASADSADLSCVRMSKVHAINGTRIDGGSR